MGIPFQAVDLAREFGHVGSHLGGSERAVDPHGEGVGMGHGVPEGIDGLPGKRSRAGVGDGYGDHDRYPAPQRGKLAVDGDQGRLRGFVRRVVNGLVPGFQVDDGEPRLHQADVTG